MGARLLESASGALLVVTGAYVVAYWLALGFQEAARSCHSERTWIMIESGTAQMTIPVIVGSSAVSIGVFAEKRR